MMANSFLPLDAVQSSVSTRSTNPGHTESPTNVCYEPLYNNQINARVLIVQSAMVYCASKPMENSLVLRIII